jgi:hypothetical protein
MSVVSQLYDKKLKHLLKKSIKKILISKKILNIEQIHLQILK